MKHHNIMPWARKLTVLSVLIALIATVYAFGAATPQETLASGHVEYVPLDWSLKPAGIGPGERFRLIFLSSTKRNATSNNIETYNTFVQNRAAAGHANIQDHASRFRVVGCTQAVDARDNTGTNTNGPGVPIYWVGGTKSPMTTTTSTTARGTMRPTTGTSWATTPTIPPRATTSPGPAATTTARSMSQPVYR